LASAIPVTPQAKPSGTKKIRRLCASERSALVGPPAILDVPVDPALVHLAEKVSQALGIKAQLRMQDDSKKPNAMAFMLEDQCVIAFGVELLKQTLQLPQFSAEVLLGYLAHEYSHVMQMQRKCFIDIVSGGGHTKFVEKDCFQSWRRIDGDQSMLELHADFMAGWTLGHLGMLTTDRFDGFSKTIFSIGDRVFDKGHHGTPRERLGAMASGYEFSRTGEVAGFYASEAMTRRPKPIRQSAASAFDVGQAVLANRKV